MNDVTRSSQFTANSLEIYDKHFEIFFKLFSFVVLIVKLYYIFMNERSQFLAFLEITYLVLLLDNICFAERLLSGRFRCFFFSSFRTIA